MRPADMGFGDQHLVQPDLFPGRHSGEPWGDERLVIRIARNDYVCDGLSAVQAAGLRAKFGELCRGIPDATAAAVPVRVFRAATSDFVDDGRGWSFDFDLDYAPQSIRVAGFRTMARIDRGPQLRAALWTCEDAALVERSILENVLRVLIADHLLEQDGLLLHSAAIADEDGADVFFGPSGAGKSTIARIMHTAGRSVLSDDMNALRIVAGALVVEKLPFAGDFGMSPSTVSGPCPVRSLNRLHQGPEAAIALLRPAAAVAALIECSPYVNRNPYRCDVLLDRLREVHALQSVRMLTFARNDRFVPLLRAHAR